MTSRRGLLRRYRQQLGVALFPLGALVVHQARYRLAFGSDASRQLASEGHGYLRGLVPWIVLAAALGLGGLLARVARARRRGEADPADGRCLVALWALASVGLLSIYVGQELLEGVFATGHPQGFAGVLGAGGLWALPAALVVGGLLALAIRGGASLIARVARLRRRRRVAPTRAPRLVVRCASVALPRLAPLAGASAGRAPPAAAL